MGTAGYSPRKTKISLGKEANYGSAAGVTLDRYWGRIQPLPIEIKKLLLKKEGLRDNIEVEGFVDAGQEVKFPINVNNILRWDFLEYVFGQASNNLAGGYYTHSLTPLNQPYHPSVMLEVAETAKTGGTDSVLSINGITVDTMDLNWAKGDFVKCKLGVIAQSASHGTTTNGTASAPSVIESHFKHVTLSIGGQAYRTLSGTFSARKNLSADFVPDASANGKIEQPKVGEFNYEIKIVVDKETSAHITAILAGSQTTAELDIDVDSNHYARFSFAAVRYGGVTEQLDLGNNVVLEELSLIPANCSASVKDDTSWA